MQLQCNHMKQVNNWTNLSTIGVINIINTINIINIINIMAFVRRRNVRWKGKWEAFNGENKSLPLFLLQEADEDHCKTKMKGTSEWEERRDCFFGNVAVGTLVNVECVARPGIGDDGSSPTPVAHSSKTHTPHSHLKVYTGALFQERVE